MMKTGLIHLIVLVMGATAAYAQAPGGAQDGTAVTQAFLKQYCVSCHNDKLKRGELSLTGLDPEQPDPGNPIWEKAIRKVQTGMMPPAGARRPDAAALQNSRQRPREPRSIALPQPIPIPGGPRCTG